MRCGASIIGHHASADTWMRQNRTKGLGQSPVLDVRGCAAGVCHRQEIRWGGKARLHLKHNRWHPDHPLSLAAVGRIVEWGLKSGPIKPCSFWCEGRDKAKVGATSPTAAPPAQQAKINDMAA